MTRLEWKPTAEIRTLQLRAALLETARAYFRSEGVMEVETPVLGHATVTDVHLASLHTRIAGHGEFYLQTSPEYAMKRLLATGAGDIYQVARVFRDAERGALHNPEFTLIEWYRRGFDAMALMQDAARLLERLLAPHRTLRAPDWVTYHEAVRTHAGLDATSAPVAELKACLTAHGIAIPRGLAASDRDGYLDLLVATIVAPKLGKGGLTFLHDYPASQAALARLKTDDPTLAERFEIFLEGIELANGFHELADSTEQRARFNADLKLRRARAMQSPPIDERLLQALSFGLPDCSGVALGFDRVVMLAAGAEKIEQVLAFPIERA
ncbi:MAG TPA: EF-P lysine aminoacylase EpmA [Steroidobacteraceae bacterium]|nr:EF-P lysine aminoacylase EpmA [Steroidobacteraceae bacterium]